MAKTPRAADYAIAAVGALFKWARSRGLTSASPTAEIAKLHSSDRADIIWTDEDLAKFCKVAAEPLQQAVRLAAYTGLRQGDLLRLQWSAVTDFAITLRTSKRRKLVVIPLSEPARTLIKEIPRRKDVATVLTSSLNRPWTSDGFRTSFMKARDKSGVKKHFHDLRGTAATKLRLTNLNNADIAQIMGWSKDRIDALMALYVDADVVALDLLARMGQKPALTNRLQTGTVRNASEPKKSN